MSDYADEFLAFADFRISAISVEIHRAESELLGNRKNVGKTVFVALSERPAEYGRVKYGLYANGVLNGLYHLRIIFFKIHICLRNFMCKLYHLRLSRARGYKKSREKLKVIILMFE